MSTTTKKKKPTVRKPAGTAEATPSPERNQKQAETRQKRTSANARQIKPKTQATTQSKTGSKPGENPAQKDQSSPARTTKQDAMLGLLSREKGATLDELVKVSGWQRHSVHGFLAGTVKKKLSLPLTSANTKNGARHYRITTAAES